MPVPLSLICRHTYTCNCSLAHVRVPSHSSGVMPHVGGRAECRTLSPTVAVSVMLRFIGRHLASLLQIPRSDRIGPVQRYELVSRGNRSYVREREKALDRGLFRSLIELSIGRAVDRASLSPNEVTKKFFVGFDKYIGVRCCRRCRITREKLNQQTRSR